MCVQRRREIRKTTVRNRNIFKKKNKHRQKCFVRLFLLNGNMVRMFGFPNALALAVTEVNDAHSTPIRYSLIIYLNVDLQIHLALQFCYTIIINHLGSTIDRFSSTICNILSNGLRALKNKLSNSVLGWCTLFSFCCRFLTNNMYVLLYYTPYSLVHFNHNPFV